MFYIQINVLQLKIYNPQTRTAALILRKLVLNKYFRTKQVEANALGSRFGKLLNTVI